MPLILLMTVVFLLFVVPVVVIFVFVDLGKRESGQLTSVRRSPGAGPK